MWVDVNGGIGWIGRWFVLNGMKFTSAFTLYAVSSSLLLLFLLLLSDAFVYLELMGSILRHMDAIGGICLGTTDDG